MWTGKYNVLIFGHINNWHERLAAMSHASNQTNPGTDSNARLSVLKLWTVIKWYEYIITVVVTIYLVQGTVYGFEKGKSMTKV